MQGPCQEDESSDIEGLEVEQEGVFTEISVVERYIVEVWGEKSGASPYQQRGHQGPARSRSSGGYVWSRYLVHRRRKM